MFTSIFMKTIHNVWPMIFIFAVILISIRITYLLCNKKQFVFYKELLMLCFIIYILLLYYIVTFQDNNYGTNNFIPFREIFRYNVSSRLFIRNVLGNILLFVPFGLFVSYIMKTRKVTPILFISLVTSGVIEYTQLKIGRTFDIDDIILNVVGGFIGYLIFIICDTLESHLPAFFSTDLFKNILAIVLCVIIFLIYTNYSLWGILR